MLSRLPVLPVTTDSPAIDVDYEREKGCVSAVVPFRVDRVRLSYPAYTHILAAARGSKVTGNLFGVQIEHTVEVGDVLPTRYVSRQPKEGEEQQRGRPELEAVPDDAWRAVLHKEELDSNVVGKFVVCSGTHSDIVFGADNVSAAAELYDSSRSPVLVSYDPSRTALLGRPALKAYTLTPAYIAHRAAVAARDAAGVTREEAAALAREGVLREVPVEVNVDAYHQMALPSVVVRPLQDCAETALSEAMAAYMQSLLASIRRNAVDLGRQMHGAYTATPPRVDEKAVLLLQQLREQGQMLESLCDGVLVNTALIREF